MFSFDLYGFTQKDIDTIRILIEKTIGVRFEAHNSSYLGDYYRYGASDSEHFVLQQNLDLLDNEPIESDYSDFPVLLYVNRTRRPEELAGLIGKLCDGVALLKHEYFEKD